MPSLRRAPLLKGNATLCPVQVQVQAQTRQNGALTIRAACDG
jgi:hypothetical protein